MELLLLAALGISLVGAVEGASEDYWAVLLEMNDFPEGWTDLPVDYINNERLQLALLNSGVPSNHLYVVNGTLSLEVVQETVEWLRNESNGNDTVLLYICTHGVWLSDVLLWNTWFPSEWMQLNVSMKILMIDSCFAEEFFEPIKADPAPHISLGSCAADEISWAGLEEEGLPIIGSVWNYYFTNALGNVSADADGNGLISVEEAFNFSTPLVQKYMNETVFTVPEFLQSYHDAGVYPEDHDAYPHPIMDDGCSGQLVIPEFPSGTLLLLCTLITMLVTVIYGKNKPKSCMHEQKKGGV
ncbi:MAG: caspase family protein [Candidatus Bathyarchaeota archaeon]|nr:MAG: caspase family protein [Candidatus Bathyarchaeota archaeon]